MKKLSPEDEALVAKMRANREKYRQEAAARGHGKPILPGGTLEKKWQDPDAFSMEPRSPTPKFSIPAAAAVARGLPPVAVSIDVLTSALVVAEPVCSDALLTLAGPNIALHVLVGRAEEPVEEVLRRCTIVSLDVTHTDSARVAIAGVAVECTCFTWHRGEAVRACCAGSIDVGGAPIVVVLECGAGLMAKPTCAQVLVTGTLGYVAETLRLELVGA